jgi:YHS domain-containing protein
MLGVKIRRYATRCSAKTVDKYMISRELDGYAPKIVWDFSFITPICTVCQSKANLWVTPDEGDTYFFLCSSTCEAEFRNDPRGCTQTVPMKLKMRLSKWWYAAAAGLATLLFSLSAYAAQLNIRFISETDLNEIHYRNEIQTGAYLCSSSQDGWGKRTCSLGGIHPGYETEFFVIAIDSNGFVSKPSDIDFATPEEYRELGRNLIGCAGATVTDAYQVLRYSVGVDEPTECLQ